MIDRLNDYFSHVVIAPCDTDLEVVAVEREAPDLGVDFIDWPREPGKTGRKDSYLDLDGARLVRKVRTGMVFLHGTADRIAAGPCLRNDNQVINFINAQYMELAAEPRLADLPCIGTGPGRTLPGHCRPLRRRQVDPHATHDGRPRGSPI